MSDYTWALNGPAMVTATTVNENGSAYLVVGPRAGQALVLMEMRGGDLFVNGVKTDLGDAYPQWLGLLDEVSDLGEGESRYLSAL